MRKIKDWAINKIFNLVKNTKSFKKLFEGKVKEEVKVKTQDLKDDFEAKMKFLIHNEFRNGITKRDEHSTPILEVPIFDNEQIAMSVDGMLDQHEIRCERRVLRLDSFCYQYSNVDLDINYLKDRIAEQVANKLIREGFISYEFVITPESRYPNILFKINVFK